MMNNEKINKIIPTEELDNVLPKYEPVKLSGKNLAQQYVSAFNTGMNIYQCVNQLQGYIEWLVHSVNTVVKSWNDSVDETLNMSIEIVKDTTTQQFNVVWEAKQPELIEQVNTLTTNQFNNEKSIFNDELKTLNSRMDTFTKLSQGSTTGDAELQDIRVGANGVTYNNAGDAVRGQYSQLKEDIGVIENVGFDVYKSRNIMNPSGITENSWLFLDGTIQTPSPYGNNTTVYNGSIVGGRKLFMTYQNNQQRNIFEVSRYVFENSSGVITSGGNILMNGIDIPIGATKIKILFNTASLNTKLQMEYDNVSDYLEYGDKILTHKKTDLDDLSIGNYIIRPNYRSGKIEPSTGEEVTPYDTARISEKLNFDNYESVNVRTTASEDPNKGAYFSVFEFDSSGKYIKQIVNTVHEYTITPTNGHLYVLQWWFGGTEFENRLPYTKVLAKSLLNKRDKEKIYADLSPKTKAKLDLPDKLFIVKGETLELFKYGMYYTDTEFINNQYNVRVVNIDEYTTQNDDKIVILCPKDYSKPILQGTNDFALFQLINTYGKVIEQQRVKIFVADKATISDIDRNIMYIGDSFTGMGFRTQEIANLIAKESNLTNTKLIGKFIGEGSGNRFTGTGGYSWANYTENPSTLPSAYPNNYLWDADNNQISMKYLVDSLGENHLEYVVILLGWNDYESGAFASSFDWDIMKQRAKRLIENIHNYYPNCKVILESYHYMYPLHRKSYGNALPQVRQNKYIYDLNRFYQKIANEYEYVEFVQMSIQIDVFHNMPFVEEKANKRSNEMVKYCKDVVHPADIGFYQYSDAEFYALLYLMQ